jgi:hypothetical protein
MAEKTKSDKAIIVKKYSGGELMYLFFRRFVCFFTFGFVFPMSWAEDVDATAYDEQFQLSSEKGKIIDLG